jgi:Transposase DDE domain group 1
LSRDLFGCRESSIFQVKKRIGSYPRVRIEGGGRAVVSQAGDVRLVETVRKAGLDTAASAALTPWRRARAVHNPGKILLDVALAVARGGDCPADVAMLRAEPAVFGPVASYPTLSRLIDTLASSEEKALRPSVPHGLKSADMSGGWPIGKRLMRAGW